MREPIRISLGGIEYLVRPLTVGQVRKVEARLTEGGLPATQAADIVGIALARDQKDLDLDGVEATARELGEGLKAILRLGGFIETTSGESPAAAGTAPSGETSSAA